VIAPQLYAFALFTSLPDAAPFSQTRPATRIARERAPKVYSKDLIELIFERPYCRIRFLEERGIAKRQAASTYLRALEEAKLLRSLRVGREVYYVNDRLMRILSE
jgi:hypothetical protein